MKILFVANRMPYPPHRGDKLKIFNLAKQLSTKHELHLITIAESAADAQYANELQPLFASISFVRLPLWRRLFNTFLGVFLFNKPLQVHYFYSRKFKKLLLNTMQSHQFDAIHVQHLRMSQYFHEGITNHAILDLPDAFSLYWLRRKEKAKSIFEKWFNQFEYNRLVAYEKKQLPKFPIVLACNKEDCDYLELISNKQINLLPNGVDTNLFDNKNGQAFIPNRILFTGNMDYAPNVDAVEYFVAEIFPLILAKNPNVKFIIAGQRPVKKVLQLASSHIEITGFVPNLAEEYSKAHLVVAPMRFGAGTQNKVLEALSMGIPVVCTNIGFKGLQMENGEGIYCELNTEQFAGRVIEILFNLELRNKLSNLASDKIRKLYSWTSVANQLENYCNQVK